MPGEVTPDELLQSAREVLIQEADAVRSLAGRIGEDFVAVIEWVVACSGRVVVTGIGKSGAIARKTAATLASTGTPAFYLHPAEGVHGDLGMVTPGDVVIALSYSGETDEILAILPVLRRLGVRLVAVTGNRRSSLAESADAMLDVSVEREACPLNLAPTTSTTTMLALLDALAVAVMRLRGFNHEDYALFHPAGSLGRRLLLRVGDLMRTGDRMASCRPDATVKDALFAITRAQAGCVFVLDDDGRFLGLLTDGDIRRILLREKNALEWPVVNALNLQPRSITPDRLVTEGLALMEQHPPCGELPVFDEERRPIGVLNLKDIVKAGIF